MCSTLVGILKGQCSSPSSCVNKFSLGWRNWVYPQCMATTWRCTMDTSIGYRSQSLLLPTVPSRTRIVHCDVKAANIFIGGGKASEYVVKFGDFGQANFDFGQFLHTQTAVLYQLKVWVKETKLNSTVYSTRVNWTWHQKKFPQWCVQHWHGDDWVYTTIVFIWSNFPPWATRKKTYNYSQQAKWSCWGC